MKIALINENSQAAKNALIEAALKKAVEPMGHTVVNYGMYTAEDKAQLTYVQIGILAAVLLGSGAADYVITGCGTGEGAMLACNSFPGIICGHVEDALDAYTFAQINDGNAIANASRIPTYYYYRQYDPATGKYLLNDKLTDFNSLGLLKEGGWNKYRNDYVNANLSAEVKIIDGLKLRGVLGADVFANHRYTRTYEVIFYNTDAQGNPIGDGRSANNDDKS